MLNPPVLLRPAPLGLLLPNPPAAPEFPERGEPPRPWASTECDWKVNVATTTNTQASCNRISRNLPKTNWMHRTAGTKQKSPYECLARRTACCCDSGLLRDNCQTS